MGVGEGGSPRPTERSDTTGHDRTVRWTWWPVVDRSLGVTFHHICVTYQSSRCDAIVTSLGASSRVRAPYVGMGRATYMGIPGTPNARDTSRPPEILPWVVLGSYRELPDVTMRAYPVYVSGGSNRVVRRPSLPNILQRNHNVRIMKWKTASWN